MNRLCSLIALASTWVTTRAAMAGGPQPAGGSEGNDPFRPLSMTHTHNADNPMWGCGAPSIPAPTSTPKPGSYSNQSSQACAPDCVRDAGAFELFQWSTLPVSETITAATVITVINKRTNSTRVITETNSEINLDDYPRPTNTNSDGTVTVKVTDLASDGKGTTVVTVYASTIHSWTPAKDMIIEHSLQSTQDTQINMSLVAHCRQV